MTALDWVLVITVVITVALFWRFSNKAIQAFDEQNRKFDVTTEDRWMHSHAENRENPIVPPNYDYIEPEKPKEISLPIFPIVDVNEGRRFSVNGVPYLDSHRLAGLLYYRAIIMEQFGHDAAAKALRAEALHIEIFAKENSG